MHAIHQALVTLEEFADEDLSFITTPDSAIQFFQSLGMIKVHDDQGIIDTSFLLREFERSTMISFTVPPPIHHERAARVVSEVKRFILSNPLIKGKDDAAKG
ncbi:MAG: hypothetical protein JSW66_07215 [Phycisphaerales bacterium]|nr:MAG: hypothetical protein JSW66_07215 [Phycisphaerales bacterium]